ncbi:MAG: hypothetical protein R3Y13_05425 [bacterium]
MNNTKLAEAINIYKNNIKNVKEREAIEDREERLLYYKSWSKEKIINMTVEEFVEYIGKLWSMVVWGNKTYIANKIIDVNGFDNLKNRLIDLLYGSEDISIRWDDFYENIKHIGPSSMSELLSYIDSDNFVICNKVTCNCFKYLGIENVPTYNYQYNGKNYKRLCDVAKNIKNEMILKGVQEANLLTVDFMFWDIIEPLSKLNEEKNIKNDCVKGDVIVNKNDSIHKTIIEQIVEIGIWLGFESESEIKVATGAVVDAVWQVKIGNMGKVMYVFEVQSKGSIDSLLLNLQKANNNSAVQGIIAVSDEKQIDKIKKECIDLPIESKLKLWNFQEVTEMYDCLKKSNEIINKLGLVPESFI